MKRGSVNSIQMCSKTSSSSSEVHHVEELLKRFNIVLSDEAQIDRMKLQSIKSELNTQRPRVFFSETSTLNIYEGYRGDLHRSNISYSPQDRDTFHAEATQEADRIKVLLITAPQQSRADSLKYLLKNNFVSREELIGIEHMALEDSNRSEIRMSHSMAVLRKQQEQQQGHASFRDPAIALGKFARKNSLESRNRARARAALASEQQHSETTATSGCYVV